MDLNGEDRRRLREAIQSAYPDPEDLKTFVTEKLDLNIAVVGGSGKYDSVVFNLIQQAIARGYIQRLILALAQDNLERQDIQHYCSLVLQQLIELNPATDSTDIIGNETIDPSIWGIDIRSTTLQGYLTKPLSFEADVGQILAGLKYADAVCKITFIDRPVTDSGTGVLIAPGLVLTNYHVLSRQIGVDLHEIAQAARFEFGYVSNQLGVTNKVQVMTAAKTSSIVAASFIEELDYALIQLSLQEEFTAQPVPYNANAQLLPRSPLNILQHPAGVEMKVSLSNNGVVKINEERGLVLYVNQAKGGSSGAPCFDRDWQLVALHHKEVATSLSSIREGILFSAIYRHIRDSTSVVVL
jgi:endonuclease G, mitochondrial